jgi:hypothetical protein
VPGKPLYDAQGVGPTGIWHVQFDKRKVKYLFPIQWLTEEFFETDAGEGFLPKPWAW